MGVFLQSREEAFICLIEHMRVFRVIFFSIEYFAHKYNQRHIIMRKKTESFRIYCAKGANERGVYA